MKNITHNSSKYYSTLLDRYSTLGLEPVNSIQPGNSQFQLFLCSTLGSRCYIGIGRVGLLKIPENALMSILQCYWHCICVVFNNFIHSILLKPLPVCGAIKYLLEQAIVEYTANQLQGTMTQFANKVLSVSICVLYFAKLL
jgi:hypothetical protein